jgi:hypothetical protein
VPLDGAAGIDGDADALAVVAALAEFVALAELAALDEEEDEDEHAAASNAIGTRAAAVPTVRILLDTMGTP